MWLPTHPKLNWLKRFPPNVSKMRGRLGRSKPGWNAADMEAQHKVPEKRREMLALCHVQKWPNSASSSPASFGGGGEERYWYLWQCAAQSYLIFELPSTLSQPRRMRSTVFVHESRRVRREETSQSADGLDVIYYVLKICAASAEAYTEKAIMKKLLGTTSRRQSQRHRCSLVAWTFCGER